MDNGAVVGFLQKHDVLDSALGKDKQLLRLLLAVRDIPWGEARTVEETLAKNQGTCTGKHLVLSACLDVLNIPYKHSICTFQWQDKKLNLPAPLQKILDEGPWRHGHNFLIIQTNPDYWVDVDITWDPVLAPYGFAVFPDNWNGKSFLSVHSYDRWDDIEVNTIKKTLINSLSPELLDRRTRFLKNFFLWVNSLRKD